MLAIVPLVGLGGLESFLSLKKGLWNPIGVPVTDDWNDIFAAPWCGGVEGSSSTPARTALIAGKSTRFSGHGIPPLDSSGREGEGRIVGRPVSLLVFFRPIDNPSTIVIYSSLESLFDVRSRESGSGKKKE
jgi:hypothetical protein